jgi:hypothetical protein
VRLGRVADERVHLGGTQVARVEAHVVGPVEAGVRERGLQEVPDGEVAARRQHEVVGLVGLQHAPHALHVLGGVAPVADAVEVAEVDVVLLAGLDGGDRARDLAGHERLAAAGRLVVEEDAVDREHVVRLAVVLGDPEAVELRGAVRGARVEGRGLALRRGSGAVQLARGGLVEARLDAREAHGLEQADRAGARGVRGVLGLVERDPHVGLGREVVDLVGLDLHHQRREARAVAQVAVVQEELRAVLMRVLVEVVDARRVERGRAADEAVDLVALAEQQLREVRAVLPRDAGDEGLLDHGSPQILMRDDGGGARARRRHHA